ncbi:SHQ1-domain-containing protein [Calocera viscosa TUFC12733]|uniref:SHQ1-domain-containing protein n=1 Tax=Calocera viscosa (strain TUFC12733) TaxID=1330018 RepID=A0A167L0J0_CALVF|nr:SHQ1-domain-containing protein [Calocera viscosa TUFC12733]
MTVRLSKTVKGEDFKDLDLLGKLMAPSTSAAAAADRRPVIEVLGEEDEGSKKAWLMQERDILLEAEKHNWHLPPTPSEPLISTRLSHPYGFLNLHSGYFSRVTDSDNEVNIFGEEAEKLSERERWEGMLANEEEKWDPEHYFADFMDDTMIKEVLVQEAAFSDLLQDTVSFTDDENAVLLQLPQREYLLTPELNRNLYLTLLPLLFSTIYDALTTFSDPTSQSAWTVSALCPSFVALNSLPSSSTLQSTMIACYRRTLAYPLYRSWALCERIREEVAGVLKKGRRGVVKVLLWTRALLDAGGPYAAYSRVWVDDYVRWTQIHASDETLVSLANELATLKMSKADIGWPLKELEQAALDMGEGDSDDESDEEPTHMRAAPL